MNIGIVPLGSSVISFIFALTVLDQFFARRKSYQLIWAIGLFMYSISTFTEFYVETYGLNQIVYRLWYLFGAIFVAAYLGMGTLYLLLRRRHAHIIMAVLGIASVYAIFMVATAEVNFSLIASLSGKALPGSVRMITPLFNTFGTFALAGGAVYSAWNFWKRGIMPHRVLSNILIAVGAILPAFGGTLIRFGAPPFALYIPEFIGIIIIFAGFLRSREVFGLYRTPFIHGFKRVPAGRA